MIQFQIARLPDEFNDAARLIEEVYTRKGYISSVAGGQPRISEYIGKDGTKTILARHGSQLLGTISVVSGENSGLPMDSIYHDELSEFRSQDVRIAEVCQFAIDKERIKQMSAVTQDKVYELDVSSGLLGLAVQYSIHKLFDYLCFAVNPKHRAFYESLGCIQIGDEKQYASVNKAPALAYVLNMNDFETIKNSNKRRHFLVQKIFDMEQPIEFFL